MFSLRSPLWALFFFQSPLFHHIFLSSSPLNVMVAFCYRPNVTPLVWGRDRITWEWISITPHHGNSLGDAIGTNARPIDHQPSPSVDRCTVGFRRHHVLISSFLNFGSFLRFC